MLFDVWFARDNKGALWFSLAVPDEPPHTAPTKAKSVRSAFGSIARAECKIAQVGIADMEMLRV